MVEKSGMRVLIVGADVAGLTLAAKLRQQGREPVLIERLPSFADAGYGVSLRALELASSMVFSVMLVGPQNRFVAAQDARTQNESERNVEVSTRFTETVVVPALRARPWLIRMKAPREEALIQTFSVSALECPCAKWRSLRADHSVRRGTDHRSVGGNPQRY